MIDMYISKTNLTDLLRQVSYFEQENAKLRDAIMADDYDHDAVNKAKERTWHQARYTVEIVEKIGIHKPEKMTGPIGAVYHWIGLWQDDFTDAA